jgi:glycerophosphoryl diester phosphodiesterase
MKKIIILCLAALGFTYSQNVKIIAHRGASSLAPENTASAWKKAIEIGADYFELDVQMSADDSLMIMHDGKVDRTTNGKGRLNSFTYEQLRALDAGSKFDARFAGEKIPTLSEAMQTAKFSSNNIGVVVEIKDANRAIVKKTIEMIKKWDMQKRVIVSDFNFAQMAEARKTDTSLSVQLFGGIKEADIDSIAAINGKWVGSSGSFNKNIIGYAHSKNISFNCWTINKAEDMKMLIDLGVDAITTNYPQLLKNVLGKK